MPKVSRTKAVKKKAAPKKRKTGGSVLDRIEALQGRSGGYKVNCYGRSGSGKTRFWSTFPKPILAMICSGGNKPGELTSIDTPENRKTIKQVVLEQSSDLTELVQHQSETEDYATLVLDHASGLQDLVMMEVGGLKEIPAQLAWGTLSQKQYGQVALQMKTRLRELLSLDCNVVIVAQEREFTPSDDNDIVMPYVGSALTPSVTGWLNPACDYIVQTFIRQKMIESEITIGDDSVPTLEKGDGVEYCLRVGPDATYTTKFRLPIGHDDLPDCIVNPTYDKFVKLIDP